MQTRRLVLALAAFALAGCAMFNRYEWYPQAQGLKCADVTWHVVTRTELTQRCGGDSNCGAVTYLMSCEVYSVYSEKVARTLYAETCPGVEPSLYNHEVECHAKRGLMHIDHLQD